jgi:metal-responsive CopG/Arc/MetJ family transcriptional regulator
MKTAVSVPDDIFEQAERLARSAGRSRSEVYSAALRDYIARHSPDQVTETLDRVIAALGGHASPDPFVAAAARGTFESSEW